jgi:hypothetical protein
MNNSEFKLKYNNDSVTIKFVIHEDDEIMYRYNLIHCQVFGLREAGFSTNVANKSKSTLLYPRNNKPFLYGVYDFVLNARKYSLRIAPYKSGLVDSKCIWYLWSSTNDENTWNDAIQLNNYLRHFGINWEKYIFGTDNFNGITPPN